MRNFLRLFGATVFAVTLAPGVTFSQTSTVGSPLRIFVDCNVSGCDFDYFRTEVPFVDYVRNREDAAVHVLVTTQGTGGGGTEYSMNFIGLRQRSGISDTLRFVSANSATRDERRKAIVSHLKVGLVRFVASTPAGEGLEVTWKDPAVSSNNAAVRSHDPWNYWVFRSRAGANFNGESSQRFLGLNGSVSANRTTKALKINTSVNGNYNENSFTFSGGEKFESFARSYGGSELIVKSLTDHWSLGQRATIGSSTFTNQKLSIRAGPAVEYNFFPYSESTRRSITVQYSAGVAAFRYTDTTIFQKLSEVRPEHSLVTSIQMTQPWGSLNSSVEGANYLDDFDKRRLVVYNSVTARLFKGFSINFFGSYAIVRDQLYLAKGGASDEEILLQRRQLATSYRYFGGMSLTYSFGSIFNNVVNPRFDGSNFFFF